MIRIDEIYNNTFWPWFKQNRPGTRLLFCDPPGNTSVASLFTFKEKDIVENDYVFFHDQEPVDTELYKDLFAKVLTSSFDISLRPKGMRSVKWPSIDDYERYANYRKLTHDPGKFFEENTDLLLKVRQLNQSLFEIKGNIVVSEKGQHVQEIQDMYGWRTHYYFFHGWACLDWYRGYDKTFLIPRARYRTPRQTFMSPNRIVGGKRDHRVLFLYHVFKNRLGHNHISAPRICEYEHQDITQIAHKYCNTYPDIEQVLAQAELPRLFSNEQTQQMTSFCLSNFEEAQNSLVYVPTETVYFGPRTHLTEKTFKAIALEMPFVLIAAAGSLEYLREYGFQTFDGILDESYDNETNDFERIERVVKLLKDLDNLSVGERQQIHRACLPIVEHNYNHFYGGGFADILWTELTTMLHGLHI